MVKRIENVYYTYQSIDGLIFDTEKEALAREASMPAVEKYFYTNPSAAKLRDRVAVWEYGQTRHWTTQAYESPAFLRGDGYYTEHHSSNDKYGVLEGKLEDVVKHILGSVKFNIDTLYIDEVKIEKVV